MEDRGPWHCSWSHARYREVSETAIGLTEEQWGNLTNLVALHMVLDRLLSLRLLVMLYSTGWVEQGAVDELLSIVAEIPFGRRIEMAKAAGLLPADVLADLKEVNRVRNGPRWTPKTGQSWTPENRPVR